MRFFSKLLSRLKAEKDEDKCDDDEIEARENLFIGKDKVAQWNKNIQRTATQPKKCK